MAEEVDFYPMWESLGMDTKAHDMLLGAVGQMYGSMFLAQENRPKACDYLNIFATNLHSGEIKEKLDAKETGEAKKIIGSFCLYVPEEIVTAAGGIPIGLCSGADFATSEVEKHLPRNTCPLIKSFAGFRLGRVCPYIQSADLVIGENTCDGKKKAYEWFATEKPMYVVDVPHVRTDETKQTWRNEIHRLADRLEQETGQKITPESLHEGIVLANNKRRALQRPRTRQSGRRLDQIPPVPFPLAASENQCRDRLLLHPPSLARQCARPHHAAGRAFRASHRAHRHQRPVAGLPGRQATARHRVGAEH